MASGTPCLQAAADRTCLPRRRLQAARQHKRQRPFVVLPEQLPCGMPVQRARHQELRQSPVLPGLAPVAAPAQPAQVVQGEGTKHRRWGQRPGYLYRKPVVHLVGRIAAYLAECVLDLVGMLAGCDAVGVQAVGMPAYLDIRGGLIAPAAGPVHRRFFPHGRTVHKASGMLCRMPAVVQHQAPELAVSDGSTHASHSRKFRFKLFAQVVT